jgi:hypothetical protein
MSPTFMGILLISAVVVVFWRIALQVLAALVLAILVFGIGQVAQAFTQEPPNPPTVIAPAPEPSVPVPDPAVPDRAAGEAPAPR